MSEITKNELKKITDKMKYKDIRDISGFESIKEKEAYNEGVMDLAEKISIILNLK